MIPVPLFFLALANYIPVDTRSSALSTSLAWFHTIAFDLALAALLARLGRAPSRLLMWTWCFRHALWLFPFFYLEYYLSDQTRWRGCHRIYIT